MPAKKLYTFKDNDIDRQFMEIILNTFANLPTYVDNTAAKAGGLLVNQPYKTATGQVMVVY